MRLTKAGVRVHWHNPYLHAILYGEERKGEDSNLQRQAHLPQALLTLVSSGAGEAPQPNLSNTERHQRCSRSRAAPNIPDTHA